VVKIKKYNPKPGRVCVGQYIVQLYGAMQKILKEQEVTDAEKASAAWAMNMTMLEVSRQWCKCPWCKRTADSIEEHLKASRKEEDVKA